MKSIVIIFLLTMLASKSYTQVGIQDALQQIEANNPTINALQAQAEGIKANARKELLPPNPSIEGGRFPAMQGAGIKYAWGVSQQFEFPTVYAKRAQLARSTNQLADANLNAARQVILLDAKFALIELVHLRKVLAEYRQRETFSKSMLEVFKKMVDAGHATAMDLNNARLRVAESSQNVRKTEANIDIINQRLKALNGYKDIIITDSVLIIQQLPPKEQLENVYLQSDPRFFASKQMVEIAQNYRNLVVHQGLPELIIGYQSEKTDAEHFSGFMAGISIPLWGNLNKRRAASIQLNATRIEQYSQNMLLENEFEELYLKALHSNISLQELSHALTDFSNINLLRHAVELGQISIIDFFNEITFLYGVTDKVLELELEYAKCYAELHRFKL